MANLIIQVFDKNANLLKEIILQNGEHLEIWAKT